MFKNKVVSRIICGSILSLIACSTAVPMVSAEGLPKPRKHTFLAPDDTRLVADIYAAKSAGVHPCVVLLHQLGKTNADMVPLVAPLLDEGFTVVNLDMRGHGISQGRMNATIPYTKFTNSDWAQLPSDLHLVLHNIITIPNVDKQQLALVGASIGANASIIEAQNSASVKAVVALSPGLDFHGLKPGDVMTNLHKPALIIAARDDAYSADSGLKLSKMDKNSSFDLLPKGGHGSQMFAAHPELPKQIATWLHKAMH
ncbi:MAG: alpha/beta fold hydrolase [Candidatus Melainabacteria bacterium]|nr:alpha/beta fold hydrolase [Candidatus Melainabacteria bacterium]